MKKLTTGQDSTLESYIQICTMIFGKDSKSVKFLQSKAAKSEYGVKEEVLADQTQVLILMSSIEEL